MRFTADTKKVNEQTIITDRQTDSESKECLNTTMHVCIQSNSINYAFLKGTKYSSLYATLC